MLNMQARSSTETTGPNHRRALPRYLGSDEVNVIIKLLIELRETTQSCATHTSATLMIAGLGGGEDLGPYGIAQCATPS